MNKQLVKIAFFSVLLTSSFVACRKKAPEKPPVVDKGSASGDVSGAWMRYTYDPISYQLIDSVKIFDKASVTINGMDVTMDSENLGTLKCQVLQIGPGFVELIMSPQESKFKNPNGKQLYWTLYNPNQKPRLYKDKKIEGLHLKLTTDMAGLNPIFADYRLDKY